MKNRKTKPLVWLAAIPLGIVVYFYDDILWGPGPIAIATSIFGHVPGLAGLAIAYFVVSFVGSSLILRRYKNKKKLSVKALRMTTKKRRDFAYTALLTGKWLGLAVACFMLGAIITSVPVGRYKLFPNINIYILAAIMSFLFVVEFLGFYAGLFGLAWQWFA